MLVVTGHAKAATNRGTMRRESKFFIVSLLGTFLWKEETVVR
jgi:hypothetical protein